MLTRKMQSISPRESGGSTGLKGLDYQNHWAICLLLKLHATEDDYAILIEHWDDVVSLDGTCPPKKINFYQVKDHKKLSLTDILRYDPKKSGDSSIIGKMHSLYKDFGESVEGCYLVTSRPITDSNSKEIISNSEYKCLKDLQECSNITTKIEKETGESCGRFVYVLRFMNSELSRKGYCEQLKGIIYDFFKKKYKCDIDVDAFYRTILPDITKKGALIFKEFQNVDMLITQKGFKRVDIENFIKETISSARHTDIDKVVEKLLTESDYEFGLRYAIKEKIKKYRSEKMQYSNDVIFELELDIITGIKKTISVSKTIRTIVSEVASGLDPQRGYKKIYSEEFITGAIYYETAKIYGEL